MNPLVIAAQGKGVLGMLKRAGTIRQRYGLTPRQMERTLAHFVHLLEEFDCGATFPIPTVTLGRSRGIIEKYQARQIEFAVHAYYHVDQTQLTFDQQLEQFNAARRVFEERGIRCEGYRSPYLRVNPDTLAAIQQAGFAYDGSQALAWDVPTEMDTHEYQRALGFYGAVSAHDYPALPRWDNNLVRIPYCLPDDEAFVDRFEASPARMTALWMDILKQTYTRGELFTVGLHPERIALCEPALLEVLQAARQLQPHVWMTQLHRISEWWKKRAQSRVRISEDGNGEMCIATDGTEGVTLLARHVQVTSPADGWDESYLLSDGPELRIRADRRPFIGVSPATPAYLSLFLRQQGYIVETAESPAQHTFYVDRTHFAYEDERSLLDEIEQGDFPLVRMGRWPDGAHSALCVTGDIDALTIWDYALRVF